MLGFGLSIPVFFATTYAWLLWIITPMLMAWLRRLQRRKRPRPEVS
jgi:predicted MFS family arabinose efflux permease